VPHQPLSELTEQSAMRNGLPSAHVHLVKHIAHHLFRRRNYVDVNDLIDIGIVALVEARRAYGYDTAEGFEAFASRFIRGAMLEFVRKANWSPALPVRGSAMQLTGIARQSSHTKTIPTAKPPRS
jgi:DNA-directed RNA polymerase specialized sigma subunit